MRVFNDIFHRIAVGVSRTVGSPIAFTVALLIVLSWALTGPVFGFSDTWQLAINTSTTIVTFLMVFLIQNTQNRDSRIVHMKLDELIKAEKGARTGMVNIEELSDEELEELHEEFRQLHETYAKQLTRRKGVTTLNEMHQVNLKK